MGALGSILFTTFEYWRALAYYLRGNSFTACPYFREPANTQARVQTCYLAKALSLWNQPHYRAPTFAHDLRANLCNVAIPGTGLPLSVFCYFKATGYLLIFCVNPLVCFFGAINVARLSRQKGTGSGGEKSWVVVLAEAYRAHLLFPEDWFSYWRLNCGLASWYWLVTKEEGFDLENKWTFLQRCMEKGVPCSPCNTTTKGLCIKHKNEEGGLGIHFFKNATQGGDWIIQEVMSNADAVAQFLPPGAPLSTFRVMTGSRLGIPSTGTAGRAATRQQQSTSSNGGDRGVGLTAAGKKAKKSKKGDENDENDGGGTTGTTDSTGGSSGSGSGGGDPGVFAFSCVFRAGRAGGLTDHDSVLFDVDQQGKKMGVGTSNMHWYQLGPGKVLTTPWLNNNKFTHHPDGQIPVTDQPIAELDKMLKVCVDAHRSLFPGVPVAGWDLCVVKGEPRMCLLEVNLMCNFFKGSFDKEKYFKFMEDYFLFLDGVEE